MGIFKQKPALKMDYKDYDDLYEDLPYYKTCNMTLASLFPNDFYNCCAFIEMDIFLKDAENGIISEAEIAYINSVESMVRQFVDVVYAGKGIVCSNATAYMLFYVSEKASQKVADIFSVMFSSGFRKTDTKIIKDPNGKKYFELLYPNKFHVRTIETDNIIKQLSDYGDDGQLSRDVKYTIHFSNKDSVLSFASEAFKSGYAYVDMIKETVEGRVLPRFKLILKTNMPFTKDLVNEKVKFLIELAEKFSGDYKGVETDIVEI